MNPLQDRTVTAMTLKANCHLVLGHKIKEPTSVEIDPFVYASGTTGVGHVRVHRRCCL